MTQRAAPSGLNTENIWQEFSNGLYGFIARRVRDPQDAKDILQDIFVKIHSKKDTLKDHDRLSAWIYRLTRNAINDFYRRLKKKPNRFESVELFDPEDSMENQLYELTCCIEPFIERLSDDDKKLIRMADLEGLKQKDMARDMGLSYSSLKTRVQRTRKKLKKMFLDCCDVALDPEKDSDATGGQEKNCGQC